MFESRRILTAFMALVLVLLPAPVLAHPGSGILVDRYGNVYFLDTGSGLWKIDTRGQLTRIADPRFHWMTLDGQDRFANSRLPSGSAGDVQKVGFTPTLMLASDWPLAIGSDGNLYYPLRHADGTALDVLRVEPDGRRANLATVKLGWVNGLAAASDGSLLFTEDKAIRRISARGAISTLVENVALPTCPKIPGNDKDVALLRGLDVDSMGNVFVAASGCGSVLKVAPDGRMTTVLQLQAPWSPTAVALFHGTVYVLEYLHTDVEDRRAWIPRVRRITPDGKSEIIAAVSR